MRQNPRSCALSTAANGPGWRRVTTATLTATFAAALAAFGGACDGDLSQVEKPATKRLIAGRARLVGDGITSCSHQPVATGGSADRWCAFTIDEVKGMPATLWAINVTKARTSNVACDGTSPHCLQLTTSLWTGEPVFEPSHPWVHGFHGDTLFFYTGGTIADEAFTGNVRAWRPGMAESRDITGPGGVFCFGHARTVAAVCLSNQKSDGRIESIEFDLQAGSVLGSGASPLPTIDRIRPYEPDRSLVWGASFSPTGEYFAYATKAPDVVRAATERPLLRLSAVPSAQLGVAAPVEVLRDVNDWSFTPDGKRLLFLRGLSTNSAGNTTGTLTVADFPAGTNPTSVATSVGRYQAYGTPGGPLLGLGLFQSSLEESVTFRFLGDISKPETVFTVAKGIENALVSPDARYTFFQDAAGADNARSLIARIDGSGRVCPLTRNAGQFAFSVQFLPKQQRVMFSEDSAIINPDTLEIPIEGWVANPDDCGQAQRFSEKLAYAQPTTDGLLFGETELGGLTMSMRHVSFLPTGSLDLDKIGGIANRVSLTSSLLDESLFVYTVEAGPDSPPGLFVHGPLP